MKSEFALNVTLRTAETVDIQRMLSVAESELNHLRKYTTIWYVAWLRGDLDVAALSAAATVLQRKHPFLAARVDPVGRRFRVTTEPVRASVVTMRADPLDDVAMLPVLSLDDGTFAVLVHPRNAGSAVAVGVDHSIADARLSYVYFHELWELYTHIVMTGEAPQTQRQPIPVAPESAMESRGLLRTTLPVKHWFGDTAWGGQPQENPAAPRTVLGWKQRFDPEASAALRAAARQRHTTVNTLITGVIALAERALIPVDDDAPVNLGFESLVDYRKHLTPPAELGEIANGIMIARSQVIVRVNDDPVQIGAEVARQITEDIDSGFLVQSVHHIGDGFLAGDFGPFIRITNPGILPIPPLPTNLVLEDFDAQLSTPRTRIADGASVPQASRYEVYSIGDEFTIVCKFPAKSLTDTQLRVLRADIVARVDALAKR
ncbi:phthiocerol/phthiodiolone dimycocerosyl transferase family protein [Mycobacteroides salmoniphilum]|uniref:phthiocerol/phthiodiolone dimycocerosyl transferase family protein n=1 Tax=Mycobacteroides salmoniphilum TaxID=404941 RepID=UPI0010E47992|nr:Phthiocerol/phthiodiolone dimycocerosyl transferase [Mycobacteroides salmoniphilum]